MVLESVLLWTLVGEGVEGGQGIRLDVFLWLEAALHLLISVAFQFGLNTKLFQDQIEKAINQLRIIVIICCNGGSVIIRGDKKAAHYLDRFRLFI